jgi:hypothetical protein
MTKTPEWPTIADGQKPASQHLERTSDLQAPKRPPNPSRFRFEQVNEVTWKLTNGEITETPASHGQWGGYKTTKALAWVIRIGSRHWLARYGDIISGPSSLPKAKAAAIAMAKGGVGDYYIANPISHLNGLTARLIDLSLIDLDEDPLPDDGGGNE